MAPEGSRWMALAGITPDGSCFLYIGRHGEVYYYFIERASEPHLLVPSPYECSCRTTTTVVTLDHLGYQGLDPGSTSSLEDRLFPTKFNMAIINNVCHRDPKRKELLIEIWQITATLHEGHVQSYTCSKLASFCEDPNYYVQHCSLRGTELAYQAKSSGTIVVVDWTRISASSSDYSRVYLQSLNAQCFALIPGKRLLIRGGRGLELREWGRDGVASSLVPSTVRRQIDWRQITLPAHPSWEREFDLDVPMVRDMTLIPFFANGSTRFVLLAEKHIYGLDISSGPVNEGLNPRVFTLAEGKFDADCLDHFTSYRRGICVLRDQTGVGFQHSWPDDPVHWPSRVDAFKLSRTSYEVLYNDAHTRMVIFSPNDMQYYCISL
ncbi:hypothetical protein BKA70DRAFT_395508 [Coprinopsis sp. MPI-PUGE-AT-0042]|nr:hypothetical protein BKA70DRAFT_395508 [Coprinopsis sp. MPI-PUGE-AT-0042]